VRMKPINLRKNENYRSIKERVNLRLQIYEFLGKSLLTKDSFDDLYQICTIDNKIRNRVVADLQKIVGASNMANVYIKIEIE